MLLKHVGSDPVVTATKGDKNCFERARDALQTLALVEPGAKTTILYLDGLVGRIGEDGTVSPLETEAKTPDAPDIQPRVVG